MKNKIVNLEIAKALKELGFETENVTPYYVGDIPYLLIDVEKWDIKKLRKTFAPMIDVIKADEEDKKRDNPIPAPTVHEALDWFESKGERYVVNVGFSNEYTAEVMQEGTFIPIGKYKSRREAEESIMKFYIRTALEEKIHKLETLTKI